MSLFQCQQCGCCENTALASQGFKGASDLFDWSGIDDRKEKLLCSACGPVKYSDGKETRYGKWHGQFSRVFLPMGEFKTNQRGNLEHITTGSEDFCKFSVQCQEQNND